MKRMICLILALAMMFTLAACGGKEEPVVTTATEVTVEVDEAVAPEATTEEAVPETTEATEAPVTVYDTTDQVLLDNESCTFSVGAVSDNELAGMQLEVTCVNKTQEALDFVWNNVSVCGIMYDPQWTVTVPAGETLESRVEIDTYALETMDIHAADEITFQLSVTSSENWMDAPYGEEFFTIYPTGLSADTVIYPVREEVASEVVLVDDESLTFIAEFVEQQDLYYVVRCYMVNKTQETLMTSWENVTVNGLAVDPFWTALIAPGKSAYSEVQFANSDLQGLGIETVEEINFDLMAYDEAGESLVNQPTTYQPVEEIALG